MPRCGGIPGLDRRHRGVDEPLEQVRDLLVQGCVLEADARLRRQRQRQVLRSRVKGNHLGLEVRRLAQPALGPPLLVDELDDPNDLLARRQHGHGQHRARLVTRFLVKGAVVLEAPRIVCRILQQRQVRDVDRPRLEHRPADNRRAVDGELRLLEIDGQRIVLRQHEVENLGATAIRQAVAVFVGGLENVHAPGVGGGHLTALGKNQVEQALDVAFRR
jgi:hypothetical protein